MRSAPIVAGPTSPHQEVAVPAAVPRFLVVDGDARLRRSLRRLLVTFAAVEEAASCDEARRLWARGRYVGLILEVGFRDGDGLEWLADARIAGETSPALVLTSRCERALVNRAYDLHADYLCKPATHTRVRLFADAAIVRAQEELDAPLRPRDVLAECIARWVPQHGLTAREAEAVAATIRGPTEVALLAKVRSVSRNTLKTLVRRGVKKLGASTVAELRMRALDQAANGVPA